MDARHLLLGENGCGKTTLLRAIAEQKLEEWPDNVSVFLVQQDAAVDRALAPLEAVLAADTATATLEEEASHLEEACAAAVDDADATEALVERLNAVYEKLYEEDASQRRRRAGDVLSGLGFEPSMLETPLGQLSGGWQMRAALAAGLFMRPALLLLDEPTNQLDLRAINWLQQHLAHEYKGTVLCVSHDRAFINEVASEIIIFSNQQLDYFSGNLDDYDREAAKSTCNLQRQVAALERKREHIQKSVNHMVEAADRRDENRSTNKDSSKYAVKTCAKSNNQVAQRLKKLGRMGLEKTADGKKYKAQDQEGPRIGAANNNDGGWVDGRMTAAPLLHRADPALRFGFQVSEPLELGEDEHLLELHSVGYTYNQSEQAVLARIDLSISENCRIGCIGKNGAGKSTLLKLLSGELKPTQGEIARQGGLRVAYMGQHDAELLQLPHTPLGHLQKEFPQVKEDELQKTLEEFGICGAAAFQPMVSLSGGQRLRVAFAKMSVERPHLLVLDEPTNHLDIYAIEALIDALKAFQGGVVFVTHNQSLLQEVAQQVITVEDCTMSVEHLSNQVLAMKNGVIRANNTVLLN